MKMNLRSLMGLLAAGSMLAVIACAAPQPAAPSQSAPTQGGGATPIPTTKLPPAEARMPTPTPVPAEVKNTTTEFANGYAELSADWDKLHGDFQDWRQGLTACEASSVQIALHEFTGWLAAITAATRSLPRDPLVRHLSDRLIEAAEVEEEALRALAENRQPGAPATNTLSPSAASALVASEEKGAGEAGAVENGNNPASDGAGSVYEGVALARSQASAIQKGVSDSLDDLQGRISPDAQEDVSELSSAVSELNEAWDQFHRNYDSFRSSEPNYNAAQRTRGINLLVNEFRGVAQAARDLPSAAGTGDVADILAEAAEAEDLLLRILRGDLGQPGEFVSNQPSTDDDSSEISTPAPPVEGNGNLPPTKPEPLPEPSSEEESSGFGSGGLAGNGLFEADADAEADSEEEPSTADPAVFYAFDRQLVEANTARRKARQLLSKIEEEVSDDGRKEVNGFAAQHKRLMAQLDDFRDDYDEWRSTEGGCDRAEVIGALGGFAARFSDLSADVRGLPKATFLRPMGELLVEAADREHKSVRDLRNTWEPFDAGVYDAVDRQRDTSDKLRRQVSSGIDELAARYGLSLSN